MTGGAGFIGSHLVDWLVKQGYTVTVLDNLSTGKLENVRGCLDDPGFKFVKGDVRDRRNVEEALKDVQAVFHLAAITSVPYSVKHPNVTVKVNVDGTRNLLEACLREGVERFIYVSSCAVYGEPEYLPVNERHPARPISPYAESKLKAENVCRSFHEKHGLKTVVFRLFNVYGPRMREGQYSGVISRFIKRLKAGKSPIIYGDGRQTRDFVYVEDVVQALISALKNEDALGKVLNIGCGVPVTINELADMLMELTGTRVKPIHRKARLGDIKHSYADIGLAKIILGFEPKTSLKEGLVRLLRGKVG